MLPTRKLAVATIAIAALVFPAGASATTKSESATIGAPAQISTLTAKCPGGQRATGGGYRASEPASSASARFFVTESRKIGQRRWRASGFKSYDPGAISLTAYVICDADAPKTKERNTALLVQGGEPVDASCGSAGKAQAGGFSSIGNPAAAQNIFLDQTFRFSKKTWRTVVGIEAGDPPTLVTHVYCADAKAPKARSVTLSVGGIDTKTFPTSPSCKHGTRVFAGGLTKARGDGTGAFGFPWEFAPFGHAWRIGGFHYGTGANLVTPIVYCG